jgi:cell division protein FtsI/penicillin-binding protein 2
MTFVIQESLNTGAIFVLNQIGKDVFYEYLKKFGFGILTGIEQPGEGAGKVYAPSETNDHGYATMTFGQNITATPIQMITSFAAIANGGKLIKPHLIAEKLFRNGKKEVTDNRPIKDVISAEAAAKEKEMMVNQVEKGHGQAAKVKGYKVAGKTGTAQVSRRDGKPGYDPARNIGSFIGFGPADSPRFVVLAKIDSPKGIPWAESSAAPIVGQMLDFLFKYYQVPPTEPI